MSCAYHKDENNVKTDQNIKLINLYVEQIWNNRNLDIADSIIHKDFVDPASTTGEKGPEAFKKVIAEYYGVFPDLIMEIDEIVSDNDMVAWKWTANTTYKPLDKHVVLQGIIMDRIQGGKIVERWGYWNESVLKE
jgi:predicted ester cyclase